MMRRVVILGPTCALAFLTVCGCRQWFIDGADREVAGLIEQRQLAALGATSDADIGAESGKIGGRSDRYSFVPSPIDASVPEAFLSATRHADETGKSTEKSSNDTPTEQASSQDKTEIEERQLFRLPDALVYAMRHARDFQSEKEALYVAALDLTLERYLWGPRFVESTLGIDYANFGQVRDFDRAMTAVSRFAVEQRLPYGGEITATVINRLMRDLGANVTSGESGQFIIDARLPLLRGAGPVAYESRYRAERELIYSVRDFERFRRRFVVEIASGYFDLLSAKTRVESAESQASNLEEDLRRAQALADAGRTLRIEASRARVSLLEARNGAVDAQERYDTSLDLYKIRIGMPTEMAIDVVEEALDLNDPRVPVEVATETALKYRLDLLNARDAIDDARRNVEVARNELLPQLDFSGSATMVTNPIRTNSSSYNTERTTWRASMDFEIPLDRKSERNAYRRALIDLRRVERDHDEAVDRVRLEVRRALRRLEQARFSMTIQTENIEINKFRADQARAQYKLGRIASNRDVVEALDGLTAARNRFAESQSEFRRAILELLRDTGTLRVRDGGGWVRHDGSNAPADATRDGS